MIKAFRTQKDSLDEVIKQEDFVLLAQKATLEFFKIYNYLSRDKVEISKKFYSHLMGVTDLTESFLDIHGARENNDWFFFTELIASIRNIAVAAFHLKHTHDRCNEYSLDKSHEEIREFIKDINFTLDFFNQMIVTLFKEMAKEAEILGLPITKDSLGENELTDILTNKRLPHTIEEDLVTDTEERVIEIARRFRKVKKIFSQENLGKTYEISELEKIVPTKLNENKLRKPRATLHSIQSEYDTYIKNTPIENDDLQQLRGHISVCLHLFIVSILLLHYYERHESTIRQSKLREKISAVIDKNKILDRAINFALYYNDLYLQKGNKIAEAILTKYAHVEKYELSVPQPLGFHARPATYVSLIVNEHGTDVFLVVNGKKFNAKSILSLMEAGGLIAAKGLKKVTYEGDKKVLDDLKILSEYNYCETCEIPPELAYLRILRNN